MYKMLVKGKVVYTSDKILANFMNRKLSFIEKIKLFFSR
jgi:hypothetical protein